MATGALLLEPAAALPPLPPDYTVRIQAAPVEIATDEILSTITYNGQFPGPLLRFDEGRQATVDVYNDTSTPEQLHWHGQFLPVDVDGAAEEGTPFIPAHGMRRVVFTPAPAGFRFYHTHNRAGANLAAGQYTGRRADPVSLPPATAHGLRFHDPVRVRLKRGRW
ncbi:MAG: multicopper oxidase domain-containing protein [Acidobacteria bacterium]|nr:multicopper oxidase domain-containing protein [Acidobacteriota bacterium]